MVSICSQNLQPQPPLWVTFTGDYPRHLHTTSVIEHFVQEKIWDHSTYVFGALGIIYYSIQNKVKRGIKTCIRRLEGQDSLTNIHKFSVKYFPRTLEINQRLQLVMVNVCRSIE